MISYTNSIAEIVQYTRPGSEFEYSAIEELASEHGEEPVYVANDVLRLRVSIATGKPI